MNYNYETGSTTGILGELKWESLKKSRKDVYCYILSRRKEEGKRRKREENGEKIGDQIAKKKKKKSVRIFFLCFGSIRNTLFREKHKCISAFVFMQEFSMNKLCEKHKCISAFVFMQEFSMNKLCDF